MHTTNVCSVPDVQFGFPGAPRGSGAPDDAAETEEEDTQKPFQRSTLVYDANGTGICEGWLYIPHSHSGKARPPIILMAAVSSGWLLGVQR